MKILEIDNSQPLIKNSNYILMHSEPKKYKVWSNNEKSYVHELDLLDEYPEAINYEDNFILNYPRLKQIQLLDLKSFESRTLECNAKIMACHNGFFFGMDSTTYEFTLMDIEFNVIHSYAEEFGTRDIFTEYGILRLPINSSAKKSFRIYESKTMELQKEFHLTSHYFNYKIHGEYCLITTTDPSGYTVNCFNLKSLTKVWTVTEEWFPTMVIDHKSMSVIMAFNRNYYEVALDSGDIINQFTVQRERSNIYPDHLSAVDDSCLYFFNCQKENVLGKIDRKTGELIVENEYVPIGLDSLNITYWDILEENKHLIHVYSGGKSKLLLAEF